MVFGDTLIGTTMAHTRRMAVHVFCDFLPAASPPLTRDGKN